MVENLRKLISEFNNSGILYCNWKGTSKIEDGLDGKSDIDLLVSKNCKNDAETVLRNTGFVLVKAQWKYRFPDVCDWLGMDDLTGKLLHIHLHYRMIAGHPGVMEYTLPWADKVLESRVKLDNEVFTIKPSWEMLVFLSRIGLEYPNKKIDIHKGTFKNSALQEFHYIQEHIVWQEFDTIVAKIFKKQSNTIQRIAQKSILDITDFNELQQVLLKVFNGVWYNRYNKALSLLKIYFIKIGSTSFKRTIWIPEKKTINRGFTIAFLGQDGAGKSTVTHDIQKWLGWKLETKVFYLGSGDEFYFPWQKRILKQLKGNDSTLTKILRGWLSFSYQLSHAMYVKKTIRKANRYIDKGGIALFDRYPQIEFKGINDGPNIKEMLLPHVPSYLQWLARMYAKKEEKILAQAVKTPPSMVIKLLLSPEESIRRKPSNNIDIINKKHLIVKTLSFPDSDVKMISAEQPYYQELIQIKTEIWEKIKSL